MKVVFEIRECRLKSSPNCTETFQRELKRGRPPVACPACKSAAKPVISPVSSVRVDSVTGVATKESICPCGKAFEIKSGRGRKATKCIDCRSAGIVYRTDDDGQIETIQAETIAREIQEKKDAAGKARAERLVAMMVPLLKRDTERRAAYAK